MAPMTVNDSRNDIPLMRIPPKYPGESCSDLQVLQCGKHADKRHRLANRFDFYALVMITKGSGTFRCDDGPVQQVRAGDVIYLKPGPAFSLAHQRVAIGMNIIAVSLENACSSGVSDGGFPIKTKSGAYPIPKC